MREENKGGERQALAQGRAGRLALLFGSESEGLPAEILSPASPLYVPSLRIPIAGQRMRDSGNR